MTPEELARIQREYLIRTEKKSAAFIAAEFAVLRREILEFLTKNLLGQATIKNLHARNFLGRILLLLDNKLDVFSILFSRRTSRAQENVINFSADSLKKFLPEIKPEIFAPDREAIQKLIGRTQTGESLQKFFLRMKPLVRERAKLELIEGFAMGESAPQIAKRINDVSEVGMARALVTSRNETVMAYRNASVEFFAGAGFTEYRFLSVLDVRTCLVCWRLHGTKWKLKTKPHIHTQCRCSILPVRRGETVETGIERFHRLEKGWQKQILGNSRFDLFEKGDSLASLVGVKKSEDFGRVFFAKNLSEL